MQTEADKKKAVIPANAGVILVAIHPKKKMKGYPRECGGDPVPSMD